MNLESVLGSATCTTTDLGCIPNDPIGFVVRFYGIGLSIIGALAVVSIIYGGYLIMTASGDPGRVNQGRGYVIYAIIGIILAVFTFAFVQVITVDVFHIPGFN